MDLVSIACSTDGTIVTYSLAGERLIPKSTSIIGNGVSVFARHGDVLYARLKDPICVVALAYESNQWQILATEPAPDTMNFLSISTDGRWLIGVSYTGGQIATWPLSDSGTLGTYRLLASHKHPHCAVIIDDFLYIAVLGEDTVVTYRFIDGTLIPIITTSAPTGSGPRHITIDESGENLYCITEFAGEILHYRRNKTTGILSFAGHYPAFSHSAGLRHSRLGADPLSEHLIWGADIALCQGFVIASERTASTLTVFPINDDGTLAASCSSVDTEKQPRAIYVVADLIISVGEKSDQVSIFKLEKNGELRRVDRKITGHGANWIDVRSAS
ncbi:MAG: lactonase family protein [Propionibacteriaceae bacterium]